MTLYIFYNIIKNKKAQKNIGTTLHAPGGSFGTALLYCSDIYYFNRQMIIPLFLPLLPPPHIQLPLYPMYIPAQGLSC